jgi:hypothetical protein
VAQQAQEEIRKITLEMAKLQSSVSSIASAIERVQAVLSTRRRDLSLGDVVAAEGRNAATRVLRNRIDEADGRIGQLAARIKELGAEMRRLLDRKRSEAIKGFFAAQLAHGAALLDVSFGDGGSISAVPRARGSEGPRGLAVYYYAFLHTAREFGSATFCPIVVDAPNQQGQDSVHLPAIINFLITDRPKDSQLILAVEEAVGISAEEATIVRVGQGRNQLLSESAYESVSAHLQPFLAKMVMRRLQE